MIWKGLMVVTGSESPIVVVLSGSMEPAFHRGVLLFLTNYEHEDIRVGEIVVFKARQKVILYTRSKRLATVRASVTVFTKLYFLRNWAH
jgi:signal peptidase I